MVATTSCTWSIPQRRVRGGRFRGPFSAPQTALRPALDLPERGGPARIDEPFAGRWMTRPRFNLDD